MEWTLGFALAEIHSNTSLLLLAKEEEEDIGREKEDKVDSVSIPLEGFFVSSVRKLRAIVQTGLRSLLGRLYRFFKKFIRA